MGRKKQVLGAGLLAGLLLLSACSAGTGSGDGQIAPVGNSAAPVESGTTGYRKITAEEGKTLMDAGGVVVVDVRRADEYEAGHIPGAVNVPNESIGDAQPAELPDLDAALIVYCRTGVRSKQTADKLVELGYTSVSDMGGIVDWSYDTVTGAEPGVYVPAEPAGILSSFATVDLDGNEVDQSILEGHELTMVNVWATFCGPCLREMPDLGELADEYADQGLRIVGLVSDVLDSDGNYSEDQLETARAAVENTGADYLHILPSADLYGLLSQIPYVPTTFFVDSEGRQVGTAYQKAMTKDQWIEIIEQTLEEAAQ